MKPEKLIEVLSVAERLKDAVRHSYTSGGRRESVAEHSWREKLLPVISRPLKKRIRIRRKKPMCWENG